MTPDCLKEITKAMVGEPDRINSGLSADKQAVHTVIGLTKDIDLLKNSNKEFRHRIKPRRL